MPPCEAIARKTVAFTGGGSGYGACDGQIAFFRYYDAELSDRDILTNYYAIIPEPHAPAAFVIGLLVAGLARHRRASAAPPAWSV